MSLTQVRFQFVSERVSRTEIKPSTIDEAADTVPLPLFPTSRKPVSSDSSSFHVILKLALDIARYYYHFISGLSRLHFLTPLFHHR
jgi:hypothetical protein